MEVHDLLKQLRQMHEERADEIARLEESLKPIQNEIDFLRKPLNDLADAIKEAVLAEGRSVEGHGIKASYRRGYTRTSWDGKLLDGFAMAHPEILAARKESTIKPSASVKILEQETA